MKRLDGYVEGNIMEFEPDIPLVSHRHKTYREEDIVPIYRNEICINCMGRFTYVLHQVRYEQDENGYDYAYVVCPECGNHVVVLDKEED